MPVILLLYGHSLGIALQSLSGGYKVGMALAWILEACYLAIIFFVLALPASGSARWYRWVAPAVAAFFTLGLAVDSRLYEALAFHLNGLIIRVAFQPGALAQIGIPTREFTRFAALALGLAGFDILLGAMFIRRFEGHRFRWWYAVVLILLPVSERLFTATLQFTGGRVVLADSDVLPLQIPFRMYQFLSKITGKPYGGEEVLAVNASHTAAPTLPPDSIRFTRRPDILLMLMESTRSDFLTDSTMPRLWRRALGGARMTHHYASASSTHYALFSIVFGLNATRLEQVVGNGRAPLLFGALRQHGYRMRLITASSVDWMGMKQTVFKDVANDLETDIPGTALQADSTMFAHARDFVARDDTAPVFLLLFLGATHFNYQYPARSRRFVPDWDGIGSISAAQVDPILMKRRAMNSAFEADWAIDDFLTWFAARRGHLPLTFVTGDHAEAFREHGRVGHGASVAEEEIHVPMVLLDDSVKPEVVTGVTSHVDIVPTLFHLLGDRHDPSLYSDGAILTAPPPGRFVVSTAGWVPRYAVVGDSLKAQFFGLDAGLGTVTLTGPNDQPLPDPGAMLRTYGPAILRALRR